MLASRVAAASAFQFDVFKLLLFLNVLASEELAGFEEAWKGKARKHLPGWSEGFKCMMVRLRMPF